jgi:hypothetical protein
MIGDESGWPNLDNEFRFTGWATARDKHVCESDASYTSLSKLMLKET